MLFPYSGGGFSWTLCGVGSFFWGILQKNQSIALNRMGEINVCYLSGPNSGGAGVIGWAESMFVIYLGGLGEVSAPNGLGFPRIMRGVIVGRERPPL